MEGNRHLSPEALTLAACVLADKGPQAAESGASREVADIPDAQSLRRAIRGGALLACGLGALLAGSNGCTTHYHYGAAGQAQSPALKVGVSHAKKSDARVLQTFTLNGQPVEIVDWPAMGGQFIRSSNWRVFGNAFEECRDFGGVRVDSWPAGPVQVAVCNDADNIKHRYDLSQHGEAEDSKYPWSVIFVDMGDNGPGGGFVDPFVKRGQ